MADPLSVLGAAVGVTSLITQVTDDCVKGFKLYHEAVSTPEAYRYLHVRMQIEQQRFINFGIEAEILFTDGVLCATLQINRSLLLAVLAEIKVLLTTYATLNGKYEDLVPRESRAQSDSTEPGTELINLLCAPNDTKPQYLASNDLAKTIRSAGLRKFGQSIARTGRNIRTIAVEPRRLVWAKFDKNSFENLISKIAELNTFLISLLDTSQIARLHDMVGKAYLEILQVHSDVGSLADLVKALDSAVRGRHTFPATTAGIEGHLLVQSVARNQEHERATQRYLGKLVDIKIRYNQGNQPIDCHPIVYNQTVSGLQLQLDDFADMRRYANDYQPDARINVQYEGRSAWIEWNYTTAGTGASRLNDQQVESRVQLLAELLCYEKPEEFRAPLCLGYVKSVDSEAQTRFGFVFGRPLEIAQELQLCSLRKLLGQILKPSLSDRIKLCVVLSRSILNFHAVGWLHKSVRSDNVILFSPPTSSSSSRSLDLTSPYVSGFDLARPGIIENMTERPWFDPTKDIYRHPFAQFSQSSGRYRRSYDIYSLGIVMLEIAMWKRIEDIIGLSDVRRAKPLTLQEIRPWILGRQCKPNANLPDTLTKSRSCLKQVASECGDVFSSVIEHCLTMDEADMTQYVGEPESSVAIRVQRITQEDILGRLERMALVL